MTGREGAEDKARRYLLEGRVLIARVDGHEVLATVRGDGAVHRVVHGRGGRDCSCPARGRCSHLIAVGTVTAPGVLVVVR